MSTNESNSSSRLKRVSSIALSGLTLLAFWIRTRNWPMVLTADGVRFLGNDTLYHMRRVFLAVSDGLRIPDLDLFLNFPAGLHPNWPPIYDQFMAAAALLLGGGQPGHVLVELVGALTPPVLGALTIPVLYHVARRLMGRPAALVAAAAGALLPYAIQVSVLGRPDHHVAALLCSSLLLLTGMQAIEARTYRAAIRGGLLAGLCLFLCMGVWIGSLVLVFAMGAAFGISLFLGLRDPARNGRLVAAGVTLFATAAILFAPIGLTSHFARTGMLMWDAPSPFHVFLFAATALALPAWRWLLAGCLPGRVRHRWRHVVGGLLLLAVVACGAWQFDVFALLSEGSDWIQKKDPLLARLVESQPLDWQSMSENFTRLVVLMPVLLGWILVEQVRRKRTMGAVLVLVWSATLVVAGWRQERFSDLLSIVAALLLGEAFELSVRLVRRLWHGAGSAGASQRSMVMAVLTALVLGLGFSYAAAPSARWLRSYWHSAPRLSRDAIYDLCFWLRDHTPDPGGYHDGSRPAYSVLASWPYGHAITYIGQRPNVANPYVGWKENREANLAPYRFFVSDDPAAAADILDAYGVRYVVVTETLTTGHFADMLVALDLPHGAFFETVQGPNGPMHSPTPRMMQSMVSRLYLQDAVGMEGLRLVYSSPTLTQVGDQQMALFKVFEFDRTPNSLKDGPISNSQQGISNVQ